MTTKTNESEPIEFTMAAMVLLLFILLPVTLAGWSLAPMSLSKITLITAFIWILIVYFIKNPETNERDIEDYPEGLSAVEMRIIKTTLGAEVRYFPEYFYRKTWRRFLAPADSKSFYIGFGDQGEAEEYIKNARLNLTTTKFYPASPMPKEGV